MTKFCALYVSDLTRSKCAVAKISPFCAETDERFRGRLGIGYYLGQEVLLIRKPIGPEINLVSMVGNANLFLFTIEDSSISLFRPEGTPPYRFRNWIGIWKIANIRSQGFAERLLFHVPDYIARDVKTDAPSELMFYLFLSYLHDMAKVTVRDVPIYSTIDAFRSSLLLFPKLLELGPSDDIPPIAGCVSNGQHIVAGAINSDLWMLSSESLEQCPLCSEMERTETHDPKIVTHDSVKVIAIAHTDSDIPPLGFSEVPKGQIIGITDGGEVVSRSIS